MILIKKSVENVQEGKINNKHILKNYNKTKIMNKIIYEKQNSFSNLV